MKLYWGILDKDNEIQFLGAREDTTYDVVVRLTEDYPERVPFRVTQFIEFRESAKLE